MIIVITFIILAIAIVFQIWAYKSSSEPLETVTNIFGITLVIPLMVASFLAVGVLNAKIVPAKIEAYSQENAKIESQVSKYMSEHPEEKENELEFSGAVSDAMIKKQIDRYISNNEKIDELTDELAECERKGSTCRWWLYFGH